MGLKDKVSKADVKQAEVDDGIDDTKIDDVLESEEAEVVETPKTKATDAEPGTDVAVKPEAHLPAESHSAQAVIASLAQMGFEGLELDFSSFVGVVLNDGEFECTNGKVMNEFGIRITKTRAKYAFRSNHEKDDDVEVVYSYDKNAATDPDSKVFEKIQEWKEEAADVKERKDYLEVWGTVEEVYEGDKEMEGSMVTLSIPPTSKGRLAGHIVTQQANLGLEPSGYLTLIKKGEKVTGVTHPFYPWDFGLVKGSANS